MAGSFPILNKIKAKLFASGGLKKTIPVDKQEDGTLSYEEGFGTVYDKPIYDGGKYISRDEFNGILADLHEQIKELQTQLTKADLKVPNATEAEHANNLRNMTDLRGTTQTLWPTNWGNNAEWIPTFAGNWENPGHIHVNNLKTKLGVNDKEPAFSVLPVSKGGTGETDKFITSTYAYLRMKTPHETRSNTSYLIDFGLYEVDEQVFIHISRKDGTWYPAMYLTNKRENSYRKGVIHIEELENQYGGIFIPTDRNRGWIYPYTTNLFFKDLTNINYSRWIYNYRQTNWSHEDNIGLILPANGTYRIIAIISRNADTVQSLAHLDINYYGGAYNLNNFRDSGWNMSYIIQKIR